MLEFFEKAKEALKLVEEGYSTDHLEPYNSLSNMVSPTLNEIEDYVTQGTDVDSSELQSRIKDMTVSCQLIVGNISDVLTPTILDDLLKVLRTGAKYNGMVARITELHQMEVKIQSRLAQVVEYERRLEAVRLARVKLQHLMSEPCTKVETVDQQIHGIEATKSQPNDTTRNFIPIFIENFVPNTSAEKTP